MSTTGINYFTQSVGAIPQLTVFYDFKESGNQPIPSIPLGNSIFSGFISGNINSFYSITGSGKFDGRTLINIQNATGLNPSPTWTMAINYEISTGQNGVLFSSFTSGNIVSGFVVGVNNSCQPYVEFYSNLGPTVIQSQNNWGSKNSLWITKTSNNLTIDYLNFNNKLFESESFAVNDNYFLFSDKYNLGGVSGAPSYFSGNNFSGYIDNFLLFSPALLPYQKTAIASGIYCNIFPPGQSITSATGTIITGYTTGLVQIFSGTTGQANEFYSYLTGQCNNITARYQAIDLTGVVYDISNTPQYQTIINYFTGVTGGFPVENEGYSRSFGMEAISYIKNVDTSDITEIFYFPNSINKTNINNSLIFDRISNKYILPSNLNSDQVNFYLDSVAQLGSGYVNSGSFYNPSVYLSGMFYISGNFLSGNNYDDLDTNIIDYITGARAFNTGNYFIISNTTGISGLALPNSSIFLNGVKLQSGLDYRAAGNNFILNDTLFYSITGGQFWTFPNDSQGVFSSGAYNNVVLPKFARDTSIVYMNGLRESVYHDYIEIANFSLLNRPSSFLNILPTIYSNTNDFLEII